MLCTNTGPAHYINTQSKMLQRVFVCIGNTPTRSDKHCAGPYQDDSDAIPLSHIYCKNILSPIFDIWHATKSSLAASFVMTLSLSLSKLSTVSSTAAAHSNQRDGSVHEAVKRCKTPHNKNRPLFRAAHSSTHTHL